MKTIIQVEHLVKNYGTVTVIKDISFSVSQGEIFAFLGTNGAGKTTTLESIQGLRKYNEGKIVVNGKMGVQLQSSSLPDGITSVEAITLFSKWAHVPVNHTLYDTFGLNEFKQKSYQKLSTGQKRRLHLALALIGDPDIVFLDEPTAGLDVEGRASLHEEIRKIKAQGKTILMASHDMAEVENLCDRIAILKDGKIAFLGTANELTASMRGKSKIHLKASRPIVNTGKAAFLETVLGYSIFSTDDLSESLLEILQFAKKQSIDIYDIKIERPSLEESFINIAREAVS